MRTIVTPFSGPSVETVNLAREPRVYTYAGGVLASERELVLCFLDDLRAAESAGADVLERWAAVSRDPLVRGGLRVLAAREARHGKVLARRLQALGGESRATLSPALQEAALAWVGSPMRGDLEKLRGLLLHHADIDTMLRPQRLVVAQLIEDHETVALLRGILDEDVVTLEWLARTARRLAHR